MDAEIGLFKGIVRFLVDGSREGVKSALENGRVDWKRFNTLVISHELAPFCCPALKGHESSVPEDFLRSSRDVSQYTSMDSELLWKEFLRIHDVFRSGGVFLLPVKGIALLKDAYLNLPYRRMEDIDLLVKESDFAAADRLMADLGYEIELLGLKEEYWIKKQLHVAYRLKHGSRPAYVELHLICDKRGKNRHILPGFEEKIREVAVDGRNVMLLSPEDTLISLALHKRRFGDTLSLKSVYDVVLLLRKYIGGFDWQYCMAQCRKYRITQAAYFILYQARLIYGKIDVPGYVWRGLRVRGLRKRLLDAFIERNTFLPDSRRIKSRYLKSYFLLHDSFLEPARHILNIPQEQFAKFYDLAPYSRKAHFLHKNRFIYIPCRAVSNFFCAQV